MIRIVISFSVFCVLFCCNSKTKKEYNEINELFLVGFWQSKNQDSFFIFNDSLCLSNVFYPYTKWKLEGDTLLIYDLGGAHLQDSLWFTYKIKKLSSDTLFLKNASYNSPYNDILLFKKRLRLEKYNVDQLSLEISSCAFDDRCKELEIKVDLVQGKVLINNLTDSSNTPIAIECSLSKEELRILIIMLNELKFEDIKGRYISNVMHAKYFILKVGLNDASEIMKTLIDSGGKAPKSLERVVTYIWATSQLKCGPEEYFKSLDF